MSVHNIHDPTHSSSGDSLLSEEDIDLFIKDEEVTLHASDTSSSEDEDDLLNIDDERQLMKQIQSKIKKQGVNTRLGLLVKCLNMILLHKSDPFLAKKHTEYLKYQRRKRQEEKDKTFYERMQEDIRKREEAQAKAARDLQQ